MVFGENFGPWPMVEIRQGKSRGLSCEGILGTCPTLLLLDLNCLAVRLLNSSRNDMDVHP